MRVTRPAARRAAAVIGVIAIGAMVVPTALGGTGIGAIFNLGRTNTVNATTTLYGSTTSRMLQVTNAGSGPALQLTTKTTVAPMRVNSSVKVANLNADKLDGIDSTGFVRPSGAIYIAARNAWQEQSEGLLKIEHDTNVINFMSDSVQTRNLMNVPEMPVALYGKELKLDGLEICYAASASAVLKVVAIDAFANQTGPISSGTTALNDTTPRTDTTCRSYTLSTPLVLTSQTEVAALAVVQYTSAPAVFTIGRTTWILEATSTPATAP